MGNPAPLNEEMRSTLSEVRKELLDFGLRNPLLNYRPLKSRGLTITSVTPSDVFRLLVEEALDTPFVPVGVNSFETSIESEKAIKDSPQAALDVRGSRRVQNRPEGLPTCHSADEMDTYWELSAMALRITVRDPPGSGQVTTGGPDFDGVVYPSGLVNVMVPKS